MDKFYKFQNNWSVKSFKCDIIFILLFWIREEKVMKEVLENILTRRTTRSFKEDQISDQELDYILEAAIHAPTGMNKQSWQFTVVQDKEKIQNLASVMERVLNRGTEYNMYNPATIILVSNEKDNSNGLADCACAMENMFLMAHAQGIGSCWINQLKTICDNEEIREILREFGVPEEHIVWGTVALGYPTGEPKEIVRNENAIIFVK